MLLFALLAAIAIALLKGVALALALIIVSGFAVQAYVHHLRKRLEAKLGHRLPRSRIE